MDEMWNFYLLRDKRGTGRISGSRPIGPPEEFISPACLNIGGAPCSSLPIGAVHAI